MATEPTKADVVDKLNEALERIRELEAGSDPRVAELEARVAELQQRESSLVDTVTQLQEEAEFVNLSQLVWDRPEDILKVYTEQQLVDLAYSEMRGQNADRSRRGLPLLELPREQAMQRGMRIVWDRRQNATAYGHGRRVIKMYDPKTQTLRQIPFEDHINNQGASIKDGIARYEIMGFKQLKPALCSRQNCMKFATKEGQGVYCSREHLTECEEAAGKVMLR